LTFVTEFSEDLGRFVTNPKSQRDPEGR